jgi:hypothetical protein
MLPHVSDAAWLAPTWDEIPRQSDASEEGGDSDVLGDSPSASVLRYIRDGGQWKRSVQDAMVRCEPPPLRGDEGKPVPMAQRIRPVRASVLVRPLENTYAAPGAPCDAWIESAWGRYFPEVAENDREGFQYPIPLSDEFWRGYGEPVEDFIQHCMIVELATAPLFKSSPLRAVIDKDYALDYLRRLLGPCRSQPDLDDGRPVEAKQIPSLMAHFAQMAWMDIQDKRRLLRCPCGTPFLTHSYQSQYCSRKCGSYFQKMTARAKQKNARTPEK